MKNLTWQNPEQLFVAQELINKVKSKCCGIKVDKKRSAIVMGATSGIGREVAQILAKRGWRIGVAGRREDILVRMLTEMDGVVAYEVIDVNTSEAVDGLHKLIEKLGGMDLYFHILLSDKRKKSV